MTVLPMTMMDATESKDAQVMALDALGRTDEERIAANRFLNASPDGAFGKRVRKVIGQ